MTAPSANNWRPSAPETAAEGAPQRELARAPDRTPEEQRRDVDGAQEQHDDGPPEEVVQGPPVVAREALAQVLDEGRVSCAALGIRLRDAGGRRLKLCVRDARFRASLKPPDGAIAHCDGAIGKRCRGFVDRQVQIAVRSQRVVRRHDPCDHDRLVVEDQLASDDGRVSREEPAPGAIREQRCLRFPRVIGPERPAGDRLTAERREVVRRDLVDEHRLGRVEPEDAPHGAAGGRDVGERRRACSPVDEIRAGDGISLRPRTRPARVDRDKLLGMWIRQRLPQLRVRHAERCRHRRDADREREDRRQRERWLTTKATQGECEIADELVRHGPRLADPCAEPPS